MLAAQWKISIPGQAGNKIETKQSIGKTEEDCGEFELYLTPWCLMVFWHFEFPNAHY